MSLRRISHYEILEKIGAGGMGEVYLAEDEQLARKVALKFLPAEMASDPHRIARLEREARAASSLNHPNILTIYEIGNVDNQYFLVSEFVEGSSLRYRLANGALRLNDALEITIQILAALDAAHSAEIIHRDIKPENIMIRPDGFVKLLDFGLAKRNLISSGDAVTALVTSPGAVIGTIAYMSPEQARGLAVDRRTDLFSTGIVLYEMIDGLRPFQGATSSDVLAQILQYDPQPLRNRHPELPEELDRFLAKALRKAQHERYQNAREFIADLKSIKQRIDFDTELRRQQASGQKTSEWKPKSDERQPWGFSLLSGLAKRIRKEPKAEEETRPAPTLSQLTFANAIEQYPDLSPDGNRLIFCRDISGIRKIILRHLISGEETELTKGRNDEIQPAWSPDGRHVYFVRARASATKLEPWDVFSGYDGGDIWSLDLETKKERKILDKAFNPSCSPAGKQIAFDASWAGPRRIWVAGSDGLNPEQMTSDTSEEVKHLRPRWSPDSKKIVFQNVERTKFDVRIADLSSREISWLTNDMVQDLNPVWSPSGKYIYYTSYRSGGLNIWRVRVDSKGRAAGAPHQLTTGAGQDVELSISIRGQRLVFSILKQNADIWRLPVNPLTGDPNGEPESLIATTREDSRGAWSHDGSMVAFNSDRTGHMNIWLHSLEQNSTRQITKGPGGDYQANWAPDGRSLAFFSSRAGTPDIWTVDLSGHLKQLTHNASININPFFSPDGRSIAYISDESGRPEVWIMNSDGSNQRQLTHIGAGGHFLRWNRNGDGILFTCPYGDKPRVFQILINSEEAEPFAEIAGGAHLSLSPDYTIFMDVVGHKTIWASPVQGSPHKLFEFKDSSVRIDYPVWSPDGKWVLFDRFCPQGGDVWMMEDFE